MLRAYVYFTKILLWMFLYYYWGYYNTYVLSILRLQEVLFLAFSWHNLLLVTGLLDYYSKYWTESVSQNMAVQECNGQQ